MSGKNQNVYRISNRNKTCCDAHIYTRRDWFAHFICQKSSCDFFFLHGQKERLFCTSYQTWEYVQYGRPLGNTSMKRKNWPTVYSSATGKTRHDSAHSANRCVHKVSCTPWCQFILQTVLSLAMKNNKFVFHMMKQLMHKGFLSFKYCMGKN